MTESTLGVKSFEKHVNHKSNDFFAKESTVSKKIDVLLLGYLDNPKI